jgi:hypothetical protein
MLSNHIVAAAAEQVERIKSNSLGASMQWLDRLTVFRRRVTGVRNRMPLMTEDNSCRRTLMNDAPTEAQNLETRKVELPKGRLRRMCK